ncbi:class II glutamine amidotransferase [Roseibium sp.]|uniref:class II glutamine amidotransferase n=1 Tax=Roseibium sp. TaxID=1936156 RepID=UPI003A97E72F
MCRLYAMRANEPTRVECSLVRAQNALMEQSRGDREGLVHGHGWGVADYPDGMPLVEKQTWAAFHGEHFAKKAARVYAKAAVAHVRRATVGEPSIENTHPFSHGRWIFAHNGTLPNFPAVRDLMIEEIDELHRTEIRGTTDSEHVFRYLLSLWSRHPEGDMLDILEKGLARIVHWCREVDPAAKIGLNVVLTDGEHMVGSRFGRSLWFLERDHTYECTICGKSHAHHEAGADYRSVEIASETLTDEAGWKEVPNGTVYAVDPDYALHFKPLSI